MATTTDVGICNRALYKIAADAITSLTPTTSVKEDEVCNAVYSDLVKETLEIFAWPFALEEANLVLTAGYGEFNSVFDPNAAATPISVSAITNASPGAVTTGTHGYSSGDKVQFSDVGGMTELEAYLDGIYTITVTAPTTFTIGVNTTNWGTYTSGGTVVRHQIMSKYDSGYTYSLPSDCLIALQLEDPTTEFEIIGSSLLTTMDEAKLKYIKDVSTVTGFGQLFIEVLACRIAAEITIPIKGVGEESLALKGMMRNDYKRALGKAQKMMMMQGYDKFDYTDSWLGIRV